MKIIPYAAASAVIALLLMQGETAHSTERTLSCTEVSSDGNGVVTLADGQKWYKVDKFENGKEYLIGIEESDGTEKLLSIGTGENRESVWKFYRETMVNSYATPYTTLYIDGVSMICWNDELSSAYSRRSSADEVWNYDNGVLSYTYNGDTKYLAYDKGSSVPYKCTADLSEAAEVSIYTNGDKLGGCIAEQPCAESYVIAGSDYAAPVFNVGLIDKPIIIDDIKWYVDGEVQDCSSLSFCAEQFVGKPAGIHRVKCSIEAHDDDNYHYREDSVEALFIIAKGAVPDSVLTFSDVHEQYRFIGDAIAEVFDRTGGYVPSLVICTGDLVNGTAADYDRMMNDYYPLVVPALGGLDTVFVAGNHDSGEAASEMSISVGLGADQDFSDGCGVIYRSGSGNGTNSLAADGILVYGINFESIRYTENGEMYFDYNRIAGQIEDFLKAEAADYHGELIIISSHSGLHTLGIQPESHNPYNNSIAQWSGLDAYNIDSSYDMVSLINKYAKEYGMDIMFLFGHNHSNNEAEFLLTPGDMIESTKRYADRKYGEQQLEFTYAQAGFLSTTIGSADARYSFIYRDGSNVVYELKKLGNKKLIEHEEIPLRYIAPVTTSSSAVTTVSALTSTVTTAAKARADKSGSPHTADRFNLIPAFAAAAALMILSRRRK